MRKAVLRILTVIAVLGTVIACSCAPDNPTLYSFGERLSELDGVDSVVVLEQQSPVFKEKYLVTFIQPLDWNDPSKGTFKQRVEIGIQGSDNINEYSTSGYFLNDGMFSKDDRNEICRKYNCNSIKIEHRYFGGSVPEGLSNDDTALWDFLTVENAAKDFNCIMEQLSTLLKGSKVFTGASKGGFITNTMAYYYPESYDAFVSYVAPLCNGTEDSELIKNVYETIGDLGYTPKEAASMRKTMLDFQVFCLENRNELQESYYQLAVDTGCTFRETVTEEILWDVMLLDFACTYWQYGFDFAELDNVLKMPESNETELDIKVQEAFGIVSTLCPPDGCSANNTIYPYYWQAEVEMGNYGYDFSYIRNAVIEKTGEDLLAVKESDEKGLIKKLIFTEEQQAILKYDDSIRNALIDWSKTTDAHVIMIYGGCDIWYAVRIPECNNKNIHVFRADSGCHTSGIEDLSENEKAKCLDLLDTWLLDSSSD